MANYKPSKEWLEKRKKKVAPRLRERIRFLERVVKSSKPKEEREHAKTQLGISQGRAERLGLTKEGYAKPRWKAETPERVRFRGAPVARPTPVTPTRPARSKFFSFGAPNIRKVARAVGRRYSWEREKKEARIIGKVSRFGPRVGRGIGGWLWRRGMTQEQWQQYKTEQRRVMAERGEYLTPTQKWLVKIGFLIVIVIIVFAILLTTNVGKAIMSKVEIVPALNKAWIGMLQAKERVVQQITGVGEWRNPYATETKEKKGVEITNIIPIKDTFLPGDKIEVIGEGFVHALDKGTEVCFKCFMDEIGGSIDEDKRCLHVLPNEERSFAVRCNFGQREFKVEGLIYKKVKFIALYKDFVTNARLRLYTLPEPEQEELGTIDPFKKYEIRDNLLDSKTRTTRSSYEYGPVKISMYVVDRQPLSDDKYLLRIGADIDKISWSGKLGKGKLFLKFPDTVESECKRELPLEDGMTKYCDFEITNVEEGLSFIEIEAKAIYNFEFSDEKSITIEKK